MQDQTKRWDCAGYLSQSVSGAETNYHKCYKESLAVDWNVSLLKLYIERVEYEAWADYPLLWLMMLNVSLVDAVGNFTEGHPLLSNVLPDIVQVPKMKGKCQGHSITVSPNSTPSWQCSFKTQEFRPQNWWKPFNDIGGRRGNGANSNRDERPWNNNNYNVEAKWRDSMILERSSKA